MNESEVEEHRIESGEEFLLITAKVIFYVDVKVKTEGENQRLESGDKFLVITAKVIFYVVVKVKEVIVKVGGGKQRIEGVSVDHSQGSFALPSCESESKPGLKVSRSSCGSQP